jgi:hypothetical protein
MTLISYGSSAGLQACLDTADLKVRTTPENKKALEKDGGWSAGRGVRIEKTAGENDIRQPNGHGLSAAIERRLRRDKAVSQRSKGVTEETVLGRLVKRKPATLKSMRVVVMVNWSRIAGIVVPARMAPTRRAQNKERRDEQSGRARSSTTKRPDLLHDHRESMHDAVGLSKCHGSF